MRTYLNQASALDGDLRDGVIAARDRYEEAFRAVLTEGAADGSFRGDIDVPLSAIFILSVLNAVDRWYREEGRLDRGDLVDHLFLLVREGLG